METKELKRKLIIVGQVLISFGLLILFLSRLTELLYGMPFVYVIDGIAAICFIVSFLLPEDRSIPVDMLDDIDDDILAKYSNKELKRLLKRRGKVW